MRTPLGKVRGLGSAQEGTEHFWRQRLTAIANIPLIAVLRRLPDRRSTAPAYAEVRAALANPLRRAGAGRWCCSRRSITCGSACRSSSRTMCMARAASSRCSCSTPSSPIAVGVAVALRPAQTGIRRLNAWPRQLDRASGKAYTYVDHKFDVVVVGAGGAGLRATLGMAEQGLQAPPASPRCSRPARTRSRRRAASPPRCRTWAPTPGSGTCTTPSRARTGWATSTPWSIWSREAPAAVYELEHYGVPFSRTEEGKIYQRPFGGHMMNFGDGPPVQRTCAAADRTGHAILHTLYGQSLKHNAQFFIEYFALDLIMEPDGTLHRRRRLEPRRRHDPPLLRQDGGAGDRRLWPRLFLGDLGAYLHRRRRRHGRARRPAAAGHGVRAVPPDRHLRRGLPDHRGRARRGRLSRQFRGRALHGALRAVGQGPCLARRRLALHDAGDPRRPRRRQEQGPHLPASRPSRSGRAARAPAGHFRNRRRSSPAST